MRRLTACTARLGAAALIGLAVVGSAAPAHAAAVGGMGVRPANFDPNDPETRAFFKRQVAPGTEFSDAVVITNSSDVPLTVYVSSVDGLTSPTSGAVYANRTDPVTEAGAWVRPATPTLTVAPHADAQMPFTVRVPADAVAGDHLAGLAFEDATPKTSGGTFAVTQVVRAVVGVEVRVAGDAVFQPTSGTPRLEELAGTKNAAVIVPLADAGGLLGKPVLGVTLTNGTYDRRVERRLDTILPGDRIDYPFVWPDDLPAGDYRITVDVAGGARAATSAGTSTIGMTLSGAANDGAAKQVTVITSRAATSPVTGYVVIALGAIVLGLLGDRLRRTLRARTA